MEPDLSGYLKSISFELCAQADRVRQLIGSQHWLSDGTHREAILASVVSRFLGSTIELSKGFVLGTNDGTYCSNEQDLLIYERTVDPPLFNESDLSIILGRSVIASVSVKATLTKQKLADSLDNVFSAHKAALMDGNRDYISFVFFYALEQSLEGKEYKLYDTMTKWYANRHRLSSADGGPLICYVACLPNLLFRTIPKPPSRVAIQGFSSPDLAGAQFVALLTEHLSRRFGSSRNGLSDLLAQEHFQQLDPPEVTAQISPT